jgi:mRNA interferase RelE/StbE
LSYTVELTTAAARQLRKIEPTTRRRLLLALRGLEMDPRPHGCRKLAGYDDAWRLRVGDFRILYEVQGTVLTVTVFRIGNRRDIYEG